MAPSARHQILGDLRRAIEYHYLSLLGGEGIKSVFDLDRRFCGREWRVVGASIPQGRHNEANPEFAQ